jgi:hypothetical protein
MQPDNSPTVATFDAKDVAALTPEGHAAATAAFKKAGFSDEQIAQKLGAAPTAQPPPNTPQDKPVSALSPDNGLSRDQKLAGYKALLKHATDKDVVLRSAAANGIQASELAPNASSVQPKMSIEDANAALRTNDPPELAAGASPQDYASLVRFDSSYTEGLSPSDVAAVHAEFTNALAAAQFPVRMTTQLVSAAVRSTAVLSKLSGNELTLTLAREGERVKRLGNTEQLVANHKLAFERMPEAFRSYANEHKLFVSADAFVQLAHVGEAIRLREGRRAKR